MLDCFSFSSIVKVFHGFQLFQNGLFKHPGILQYFVWRFWNFENMDPHTLYLLRKYSKTYKKHVETSYSNIIAVNVGIQKFEMLESRRIDLLAIWNLGIWKT